MILLNWLTVTGLLLCLCGVVIFAWGFIIPRMQALEVGVARIPGETAEENLGLPAVCDRRRMARRALWGMLFLVAGFILQILGNLPVLP
ncbi:hypothetical protein HUU39_27085 [candidate division KSB1 bacterium]|nr:hypothetical protein [bacterium]NUM68889.1 hypothetical protein [candidate division KSB1 bacterium]